MAGTNSNQKNIKYYSLKAKAGEADAETPRFKMAEKVNGKWELTQQFDSMEGFITGASIKENTNPTTGAKSNVFVLTFADDNETSKVEFTHNNITHSVINSLASDLNTISIYKIWVGKKKDSKGKWWGTCGVSSNTATENLKWHIDPQSAPKKEPILKANGEPVLKDGVPMMDDSELKKFWENIFRDKIMGALGSKPASSASTPAATVISSAAATEDYNNSIQPDDDGLGLPF